MTPTKLPLIVGLAPNKEIFVDHLQTFQPRSVVSLPPVKAKGWQLKQYAILADGRAFDDDVVSAAGTEAINRLPAAGSLLDETTNHGVGFQLIHFAQTAVVSPVFYWQWGSVLANIGQIRANWETPTEFADGVEDIIGCIWEMDVVSFEVGAWKATLLTDIGTPSERLDAYLAQRFP
jgi:hypothetical protein